jgi:hypothetical protein
VTGLQEVAPTGSATFDRRAEMMYLLRRYILGRDFFLRPDCVIMFPKRSGAITPSAFERPMRRLTDLTITMAS